MRTARFTSRGLSARPAVGTSESGKWIVRTVNFAGERLMAEIGGGRLDEKACASQHQVANLALFVCAPGNVAKGAQGLVQLQEGGNSLVRRRRHELAGRSFNQACDRAAVPDA